MKSLDLTILIVSLNTRELTQNCLRSVYEQTAGMQFEVILVDNASTDGSADAVAREFPQVKLMTAGRNLGFAAANNLAAEGALGEYLLLLNPDTVVLDGAIQKLLEFARRDGGSGIYGGRTMYPDGSLNPTSCWGLPTLWSGFCRTAGLSAMFPGSAWFDPESLGGWQRDTVREVGMVTGCLLLLRRELWRRLDGFDTRFFMYCEDADLCMRARALGARCVICPEATIIHYGGASERIRADKVVRLFVAKAQLFRKHWNPLAAAIGVGLLSWWALSRVIVLWLAKSVQSIRTESYQAWRSIWQRRAEWVRAAAGSGAAKQ